MSFIDKFFKSMLYELINVGIAVIAILSLLILGDTWYFCCEKVFYGVLIYWTFALSLAWLIHQFKDDTSDTFLSECDLLCTKKRVLLWFLPIALIALAGYYRFYIPQPDNETEPWIQCHLDTSKIQETNNTVPATVPIQESIPIGHFEQLTPYEAALYYAANWEKKDQITNYYESAFADYVSYIDYEDLKPISQLLANTPLSGQADKYIQAQQELRLKEIAENLEQQRKVFLQYFNEDVATAVKFALDSVLYDEAEQLIDDYKGNIIFGHLQMLFGKGPKYLAVKWFDHIGQSSTTNQKAFTDYIGVYNEMLTKLRKEALHGYLPGIELKYTTNVTDFKYRYPYTENISKAADTFIDSSNWEDGRDLLLDLIGCIPGIGTLFSIGATGWIIYEALTSEEATPKQIVSAAMVIGCFENIQNTFDHQAALLEKQLQAEDEQLLKLIAERL